MYDMARRGDYGLKIVDDDFSHYKRYGSAVMVSDKLSQQDLLDLQDEGYARIYSKAWRFIPMLKKTGIIGALITLKKVIKYQIRKRW